MRYVFSTGKEVDSLDVFGLHRRQLHGGQRQPYLHLVLHRRFAARHARLRLDDFQPQARRHRPCAEQRHLHRAEPQTGELPRLCIRRQERQHDVRGGNRHGRHHRRCLQPCDDARIRHLVRLAAHVSVRRAAVVLPHVHRQGVQEPAAGRGSATVAEKGSALLQHRQSRCREHPFRQHSGGQGALRPADARQGHRRAVVQRACRESARHHKG